MAHGSELLSGVFLLLLVFPNSTDTHDETTQQRSSNDMRVALTTVSECGLLRRNCLNIEREHISVVGESTL